MRIKMNVGKFYIFYAPKGFMGLFKRENLQKFMAFA
jgi:hypothetical protein